MSERIDPRLMREGRRARGALYGSIALGLVSAWAVIGQAVILARLVEAISFRHILLPPLMPLIAGLAALFLLRAGLSHAAEALASRACLAIKSGLRAALLARLFARGPAAEAASAETAATLLDGVEALDPYFSRYLPQMALCVAVPLAILAVVLPLDWISFTVLLLAGPLIPFFMVLVGYRAEAANQRQWDKLLRLGAHFLDVLQGLTTLKLFGRARDEIRIIARISDEYRRTTMEGLRIAFLTSAVLEFFASLAIALVAVLFGARLIHGHFGFYPAFLVLLLAPEYFVPLRGLAVHYHARMSTIAAARQIFAVLDAPAPPRGTAELAAAAGIEIVCAQLSFAYEGRKVLEDVSAKFPAGKLTVIVGASGAGKTTLARLLLGFLRPTAGHILVNGQDLAEIAPESWWRALAWVPQTPRLFPGSVEENIALGLPQVDFARLRAAATRAQAYNFIEALPGRFATPVGEGGGNFSGGEIQRLALARAYARHARVLIMDEATASLDPQTEAAVLDALTALNEGCTTIIIAHRLAVAERADQILVLEAGRLMQSGTHAELLAVAGPYRELARAGEAANV
ncbi:thiol reductant ABC exporter subunit CydD [Acidocella sp.]|uniref:thiol reductant ABC exporter subunit CydD n=1 Tax=Acidocella sp. TaxID=50710 RepID=UPI00262E7E05|nr:thiol reductant ABC exporter subunit CydD [Acidocella sp.]